MLPKGKAVFSLSFFGINGQNIDNSSPFCFNHLVGSIKSFSEIKRHISGSGVGVLPSNASCLVLHISD